MLKRRIVSLVLALAFLLSTVGPALAMPADSADSDQLPPGLAKKVFIHYDKDYAQKTFGLQAAAATEPVCTAGAGTSDCNTYWYTGTHWFSGSVTYKINPNWNTKKSKGLTLSIVSEAIGKSFQAWQDASNQGIVFSYQGTSTARPGRYDRQNVVGWANLSGGTLAVTTIWSYPDTGQIVETDIAFNNSYAWSYTAPNGNCGATDFSCNPTNSGPANTYDIRNIGTHEAGHTLMLLDLYNPANNALTMYGYGSAGELAKDTLGNGDILGVNSIY